MRRQGQEDDDDADEQGRPTTETTDTAATGGTTYGGATTPDGGGGGGATRPLRGASNRVSFCCLAGASGGIQTNRGLESMKKIAIVLFVGLGGACGLRQEEGPGGSGRRRPGSARFGRRFGAARRLGSGSARGGCGG